MASIEPTLFFEASCDRIINRERTESSHRGFMGGLWADRTVRAAFQCERCKQSDVCETCNRPINKGFSQYRRFCMRGRSSVWLERLPVTQEVAGSNPVGPANIFDDSWVAAESVLIALWWKL